MKHGISGINCNNKNILFLQGPLGFFFKKLDFLLRQKGATTFKICLNAGDYFFSYKDNSTNFTGHPSEWIKFIKSFLINNRIDIIFLHGDCRFYHKEAINVAKKMGIKVFVTEEGYIRPNYITIEENGTNAFSSMPLEQNFYKNLPASQAIENNCVVQNAYQKMASQATVYYILMELFKYRYPHYQHHRETSPYKECGYGLRSFFRKSLNKVKEKKRNNYFKTGLSGKYYFVPLQTHNDCQCHVHSDYSTIEMFIKEVMTSFANHAPQDTFLVFKHHPMDRGIKNYQSFINKHSTEWGITERVLYVHDVHLPTCLKNAIGTITINSTVGIASLFHQTPTIVLGNANYNISGLTCKGMRLDNFWTDYTPPDNLLFHKFRNYIIRTTQFEGSLYTGFPKELSTAFGKDLYNYPNMNRFSKPLLKNIFSYLNI